MTNEKKRGISRVGACDQIITSHVLLPLIHNKGIASMCLLAFLRLSFIFDNSYSFNRTKATKFAFEIRLFGLIAEASNKQSLDGITLYFLIC